MNEEDALDLTSDTKRQMQFVIRTKNIMIILLAIIIAASMFAMIQQKESDMKACVNYMIQNWSLTTGMPYYDPDKGAIVRPDTLKGNLTINISK